MYLEAREIPKSNLLTSWKGREGKFVRTFGMNSKRNKNKWRATWESIKKNIHTAIGYPGIEYEVCRADGCDLEHVEAETFEENIEKQKPYNRTEIIDYILDEKEESTDLIHEVYDDKFWGKLQSGEIKYVSPLIWPRAHGATVIGHDDNGTPIIDATDWRFAHDAFLKTKPAYGEDTATVKTMCEGKGCDIQLLSAQAEEPSMGAETNVANQDNLKHLQQISLLVKHKGQLILMAADSCVSNKISHLADSRPEMDQDQRIAVAMSECGQSSSLKSSFKTCTCDARQKKMADDESMRKENEELKAQLKAMEDDKHKEDAYESKKARYAKLFANVEEEEREKMVANLKAMDEDEDELKAAMDIDDEMKSKKGQDKDDDKTKDLKARLTLLEAKESKQMITEMVSLQAKYGLNKKELNEFHASLKGQEHSEILRLYEHDKPIIKSLKANKTVEEENSIETMNFNGEDIGSLSGKTFDEIKESA